MRIHSQYQAPNLRRNTRAFGYKTKGFSSRVKPTHRAMNAPTQGLLVLAGSSPLVRSCCKSLVEFMRNEERTGGRMYSVNCATNMCSGIVRETQNMTANGTQFE